MTPFDRRRFLFGAAGLGGAAALAACSSGASSKAGGPATSRPGPATSTTDPAHALVAPGSAGLVAESIWQQRATDYLRFATAEFHPDDETGVAVQLVRAHRDPGYSWPIAKVTVDSLAETWNQIDTWQDTRDFRILYLHWLLQLGQGTTASTTLDPTVIAAIEKRMLENRYRWDDPLPADRVDEQWFWSENHRLIVLTNEYLAGQRFPTKAFAVTGLTGAEHRKRSRQPILDWIHEKARFGFFEWHSHVYMLKNISPLLTLVEQANDAELVAAAARALDLCLFDMAAHTHKGAFAATRGRTYKKDKMTARDEDTFGSSKLLYADTALPYPSATDTGATYFAAAKRYRTPQVLLDVATSKRAGVTRERHGIYLDAAAPVTEHPTPPFGYSFDDPKNLPFWWSQGAIGAWQLARMSLHQADVHRLWESQLFAQIKLLRDVNGGDPERIRAWEQANEAIVDFGHLQEANTYSWRNDEVALATVVDHRKGAMRDQVHTWQATIDPDALVFTTHPLTGIAKSTDWSEDPSPGYWTGEASMPRSAQHERTGIHIYQPAWDATTDALLWSAFEYRAYTHAYVPQDHFDEVVQDGNWTLARKGKGYIALWSQRAPTWRVYDPTVYATRGMTKPFDLIAEGGPDNVWIVEVGDASLGSFATWRRAITAHAPVAASTADKTVTWESPTSGTVAFGWTKPFTVDGKAQPLADFPRHESAFAHVDRLATRYRIHGDGSSLSLDFDLGTRSVS